MSFEEKAVLVESQTDKYRWKQSREEVQIAIECEQATRGKDVQITMSANHLKVTIHNKPIIDGTLCKRINADESTWTVVDRKVVEIVLIKGVVHDTWNCVVEGDAGTDASEQKRMEEQMLLEKFQEQNPGFDFSGAEFNGALPQDPANFMDNLGPQ